MVVFHSPAEASAGFGLNVSDYQSEQHNLKIERYSDEYTDSDCLRGSGLKQYPALIAAKTCEDQDGVPRRVRDR